MATAGGVRVKDSAGQVTTLGPIFEDHGKLYSVVASHAIKPLSKLTLAASDAVVGQVQSGVLNSALIKSRDISSGLRTVELQAGTVVKVDVRYSSIGDPLEFLGMSVSTPHSSAAGRITAVDAPFHMRARGEQNVLEYSGAFEITASEASCFANAGDAGSAVYTDDGSLVGILIGKAGGRFYAVPMTTIVSKFSLQLATKAHIQSHNARSMAPSRLFMGSSRALPSIFLPATVSPASVNRDRRAKLSILGVQLDANYRRTNSTSIEPVPRTGWDKILDAGLELGKGVTSGLILSTNHFKPTVSPHAVHDLLAFPVPVSPDLNVSNLVDRVDEVANLLTHGNNSVITAKYNVVVGAEKFLNTPELTYEKVIGSLKRSLQSAGVDVDNLMRHYGQHVSRTAFNHLQSGHNVSIATAAFFLAGAKEALSRDDLRIFSDLYLDPAVYYVERGGLELENLLKNRRMAREFDDVFRQMAPAEYRQVSTARLISEVTEGRPVRRATASYITSAASIVGNNGLIWKQVFNGGISPAASETFVSTASQAQRRKVSE